MTKEKMVAVFENTLSANQNGEVRNILITDPNKDFLESGLKILRDWTKEKGIHLVELDEADDSWLSEIQSRELFYKLNQPNTVLLIKNYATVNWCDADENTPRNFLRDAVLNRHYGCGNDFVPSDDLPNLLFVVALNGIGEMYWEKNEPDSFAVIHEDDSIKTYIYTKIKTRCSHLYPVLSDKNQFLYFISEDKKGLMFRTGMTVPNVREFRIFVPLLPQYIYEYLERNASEFKNEVECLIVQSTLRCGNGILLLDANRLRSIFLNLNTVLCPDDVKIENTDIGIRVIDPFELGEKGIERKLKGDTDGAYRCIKLAEHLDSDCGAFYWNAVEEDAKSSKENK